MSEGDFRCHCQLFNNELGNVTCPLCSNEIPALGQLERAKALLSSEKELLTLKLKEMDEQHHEFLEIITSLEKKVAQVTQEIEGKRKENENLRHDLHVMGEKLLDEVEKRAELQHAKEAFQDELEELSKSLFEQANGLVADEARRRFQHEKRETVLEQENEQLKLQISIEQEQLRELKVKIGQLMTMSESSNQRPLLSIESTIDQMLLDQFANFVENAHLTKPGKLTSIPWLKSVVEEDVEPCLQFGGNPKTSTKKLLEAILLNSCYIERIPQNCQQYNHQDTTDDNTIPPTATVFSRTITERLSSFSLFTNSPVMATATHVLPIINSCSTCAKSIACQHHFKTTSLSEDLWYPICGYCHDRFIAVCDFFSFIRQIRAQVLVKPLKELYLRSNELRQAMFYSRLGVLSNLSEAVAVAHSDSDQQSVNGMHGNGLMIVDSAPTEVKEAPSDVSNEAKEAPSPTEEIETLASE